MFMAFALALTALTLSNKTTQSNILRLFGALAKFLCAAFGRRGDDSKK
jgi:hypothetical protein